MGGMSASECSNADAGDEQEYALVRICPGGS